MSNALSTLYINGLTSHFGHTIPVFEQLPLLFGQLKKQSGRSILFFLYHEMTTPMFCVLALLFSF